MPPLLWPLLWLVAGILVSPFLDLRYAGTAISTACVLAFARPRLGLIAIGLGGALLAANDSAGPPIVTDDGLPHRVRARLATPPRAQGEGVYFLADVVAVDGTPIRGGRARVAWFPDAYTSLASFEDLDLGRQDLIDVLVHLRRPTGFRTPGVFDYAEYLNREGVHWVGTIRSQRLVEVRERGWHGPDRVRDWAGGRIARHFSDETTGPLVLGMVLGQRRLLPAATEQKFEEAGLIHMLVVSGFNLAVVAATALRVGQVLPLGRHQRVGRRAFALVLILIYAMLVEGGAPVLRATLMAALLIAGKALDRGYAVGNALALTAIVILTLRPSSLQDPSFQLSFGAVLAILAVGGPASSWAFHRIRLALKHLTNTRVDRQVDDRATDLRVRLRLQAEYRGWPVAWIAGPLRGLYLLAEVALVTACIQVCLLPFAIESFHRLAPISIPLNIIGAVVAAIVTPLGLTLIVLPEHPGAGIAWIMATLVGQLVAAVDWGLMIPGATMRVPSAPPAAWVTFAVGLILIVAAARRRSLAGLASGGLATLATLIAMAAGNFSPAPPAYPTLTFLDVGQGDSTLVELPDGRRIVIDGGGMLTAGSDTQSGFRVGEEVVSSYLFSRRIRRLDTLVLTHAHHDHMDGLFDLVENFEIGEVWLGPNPVVGRYREFLEALYVRGIPIRHVRAGDLAPPFEVLNPPVDRVVGRDVQNDDSVVLLLRWERRTALLPGDLEGRLPAAPRITDVLKVPHHGSANTRLETRGRIPVISVGANNRFGHPGENRLPALRTDVLGTISITLAPGGPEVRFPRLR